MEECCFEFEFEAVTISQMKLDSDVPDAVPSALGATRPRLSLGPHDSSLNLERAGQKVAPIDPARWAESSSNHLNAPTRVKSWHYPARRSLLPLPVYLNYIVTLEAADVG
ncbi:hypothetical protein COLO4_06147 [Corchorus olitorius]|uniref:Uncharacterized protein n=1 Tax=Corchorus olitorius TaxID=93759 RepID=A0A1R3KP38_9ROSI|nr:hypothetical protein COLO4_06147 [Corchorus olitorius]